MKYFDEVMILTEDYEKNGLKKGARGIVVSPMITDNTFKVIFFDGNNWDFILHDIFIGHLTEKTRGCSTDKDILKRLPKRNKSLWCKVEDGFILNLNGEVKNKIPYEYVIEYYKKEQTD